MAEHHARDHAQQVNIGRDSTGTINITTMHHTGQPRPIVTAALCRNVGTFIGRDRELERILQAAGPGRVLSIYTIDGMAGVGKTALALRAAHALKSEFPDGQYFVELHAHTPGQAPADPSEVLAGLLAELDVDPRYLPDSLTGRQNMWRDWLANKRVLLVLDDACDHRQIEPLLPASDGCVALVTSRRRLIALDDALPVPLDVLAHAPATKLFATLAHRTPDTDAERAAVTELVEGCGFLPLAIVLLARRLAHHPAWSITYLSSVFAAATDRLAELDVDHRAVRAAFTLSYQDLTPQQQKIFRQLGLHPGPDTDARAAAVLAGLPVMVAQRELEALYTDHLLDETGPGRYRLHDLLREYTRTLTADNDNAMQRLLDYYQHTASTADRYLARRTRPTRDQPASDPDTPAQNFADEMAALAWMRLERANLLACLEHTAVHQSARMVELTELLAGLLERDGPWPQARQLHQRAADAAERLGDRLGQANALNNLGAIYTNTGEYSAAAELYGQALAIYREVENHLGEANALVNLGLICWNIGDYDAAAELYGQALAIHRQVENHLGEASTLGNLGIVRWNIGDYGEATELQQQALAIFQQIGNRLGEANTLNNLGIVRRDTGDYREAAELQQKALTIFQQIGNRLGEANTLIDLGIACSRMGDCSEAVDLQQQGLAISRKIGHRLGETEALNEIGIVLLETGAPDGALRMFTEGLGVASDIHSQREQARALEGTARCLAALGDTHTAIAHLREAVEIYSRIGAPETDTATTYLAMLEAHPPSPST
ncbi:tetratricopeptide repeat protein [Nocardia sp. CA2R105]|uniref:ATP-binding protein n=1 Tax=Nocardia coffeae TaxID=2873381 RepID=UPI001CA65533|nr:tetratricopeptide repeat protein [Nocardia coffeae]MBY8864003.1 tetratricopeptide repeat protein [Nocardia coffeae]